MVAGGLRGLGRAALGSLAVATVVRAACNNLCSGHGDCSAASECDCYPNWMGSDCSQRVCGYTKSYINAPAYGDMNGDGVIDMKINRREDDQAWATEAYNIEYGLGRPPLDGSDEQTQWDEGHFYAECGNVGICDRSTGLCECFPGYSGASCQRTECPGRIDGETIRDTVVCSGYGRCVPAYESLSLDYKLWDRTSTTKCECDPWYTGVDCSLRKCPHSIDPLASADYVHNRMQKITFPAYDIDFDATTAPWGDFRAKVNGLVMFTMSAVDVYGDEWTTAVNTFTYITTCDDVAAKSCHVQPYFDQDVLDSYNGVTGDADLTALFGQSLLADQVNKTLQSLPTQSFPEDDMYVWMDYTLYNFQYPSPSYESDDTQYVAASYTKWPDFSNADAVNCGGALDYVSITGVDAEEGLCVFVRSPFLTPEDSLITIRYSYHDGVTDTATNPNPLEAQRFREWTGTSSTLTRNASLITSVATMGSGLLSTDWPFVTVEEVGHHRNWNEAEDGLPVLQFAAPTVAECSNRGLCNRVRARDDMSCSPCDPDFTGECACLDGYAGRACDYQDTTIAQGVVVF